MLPSRCLRCGAVSRDPLCASCLDFLVAYRPLWLDPALLPGPSLLDLLAPREVAVLPAEGDRIEWRSIPRESSAQDAVRLIRFLDLDSGGDAVVSIGDAEILHAFLGQARRTPPTDPAERSVLATLCRFLATRDWIPPHLAEEYRLRSRALTPVPSEERGEIPPAVSRAGEVEPEKTEKLPSAGPEPSEPEPAEEVEPEPLPESPAPVEEAEPVSEKTAVLPEEEAPEPVSPLPAPEPPVPIPEPEPSPMPEPEPEEKPSEPSAPPPSPPPALEPAVVMEKLSAEIAEIKADLEREIAKEREDVQAWIRQKAGELESKEQALRAMEETLAVQTKDVEAQKASVTERLQELEKDEARLQVLQFLDSVPGMTEDVANVLATAFSDMASLRGADVKALTQCQGVTEALAKAIRYDLVPGEVEEEQRAIDLREEAQSFLEEGDYRAALQCYDRLLAEHPQDKVYWFDKAELHVLLDEPEDALQCYTRVLDLDRRNRQAWFERANLLFGMGRLADAIDALREALKIHPRKSGDVVLKAEQLRRDGHANEAAILYQAVLDVDPGNGRAVLGLGDTFLVLGDIDAAEGLFTRALGKEGRDPELLFRKGELLNRKGRWGAAIQFYNRALAMKWDFPDGWLAKGRVLLAHDRAQEALECFDKVLSFDRENPEALAGKAKAEDMLKPLHLPPRKAERAEPPRPEEELLEPVEPEEAPHEDKASATFAEALKEAIGEEEKEGAADIPADFKSFVESVEPEREDTHVLLQLAELALEGGDADMALLRYQQAIDQDPHSSDAWTGKGTALQQLERYEEALAAYDHALELNPDNDLAKRWRETCLRHLSQGGEL